MQDHIAELGLAGGKAPSSPGTIDTVKNLAEADILSEVESENSQRLDGKYAHNLGDPTIQFEIATMISGVCKPTIGAMIRLMRIRCCIDRPTLSWRFKLDRPQQKLALIVDGRPRI